MHTAHIICKLLQERQVQLLGKHQQLRSMDVVLRNPLVPFMSGSPEKDIRGRAEIVNPRLCGLNWE
jgi:hypothetical protein